MNRMKRKKVHAALMTVFGAGLLAVTGAQAQQQAQRVEKIEVTGTQLKRVDVEGPLPVTIITREDLQRSASQNLNDVLQNLTASVGSFNESQNAGNSFAPGTAAISLRGLGAQTTLVLLNGRRIANYGFAQNINVAFVDLNAIPVSAIERIEILKEGASAIYGSDAIAGVVNIILRKDFRGVEGTVGYGVSSRSDADETRVSLTAGAGDIARQRFNVMVALDYYKRDPLFGDAREISRTADYRRFRGGLDLRSPTGFPGTWLTAQTPVPVAQRLPANVPFPGCTAEALDQALNPLGVCAYNFQPDVMILARTERKGFMGRGVYEFGPRLQAFAEFGYSENDSQRQLAPSPDSFTLPVGHNSNPYPFPVAIAYRFTDVGPRVDDINSKTTRYVLGLRGTIREWDWEAAYLNGKNEIVDIGTNFISFPARSALVAGNVYNFVDRSRNSAELINSLRAVPMRFGDSKVESIDAKVSGTLFNLPTGPLGLAVGAERREESVLDRRDPLSAAGQIVGSGGTAADGSRSMNAVFGEVSIPFLTNAEAQIAVRREDYSDYGSSTVPKFAVSFRPTNAMLVRAGYNKGFRAPALAELYLGQSISFNAIIDTTRCNAYRAAFGLTDPRSQGACAALQTRTLTGGNPNLEAENSESGTAGFVWDITPQFSAALDYYHIRHTGRIDTPSLTFIVNNEGLFPGAVVRDPRTALDIQANAPGPIVGTASDERIGVSAFYFNATSQSTRGYDLELRYRMPMGSAGRLALVSSNTYVVSFARATTAGQPATQFVGTAGLGTGYPRYRGTHSAVWTRGPWDLSGTVNMIGKYAQPQQPIPGETLRVTAWTTLDAQASFTGFRNLKLTGGVRNVFDRMAPFFNNQSSGGIDYNLHNLLGRFYYARATFAWR